MRESKRDFDDHGVWLDFNSLDVEGCWTSGGGEASCPYSSSVQQMDTLEKRVILVCCYVFCCPFSLRELI